MSDHVFAGILPYWVLLTLAVFRLTDLISIDTITEPLRNAIGRKSTSSKAWRFLAELVHCQYCAGVWVALLGTVASTFVVRLSVIDFLMLWLSVAGGQALLAGFTSE